MRETGTRGLSGVPEDLSENIRSHCWVETKDVIEARSKVHLAKLKLATEEYEIREIDLIVICWRRRTLSTNLATVPGSILKKHVLLRYH